jgi:hypothetical protein
MIAGEKHSSFYYSEKFYKFGLGAAANISNEAT